MSLATGTIDAAGRVIGAFGAVLDDLFTSEEEKAKVLIAMERLRQQPVIHNLMIDRTEAAHPSVFVSGARPAMKWIVGAGIAYEAVLRPVFGWLAAIYGAYNGVAIPPPPSIGLESLVALSFSGAGLYAARSYERARGVARENLSDPAPKISRPHP